MGLVSARFIDASMHRDTCHAIRIAIQFAIIAILNFFFSLDTIIVDSETAYR